MKYRILPGHSFRDSDGSLKTGGELIELSDDQAPDHVRAGRVEPLDEPPAAAGASADDEA